MHAGAVVYVGDLDRMRSFYERCLGLVVADSADGYCGLRSRTQLLTLVRSAEASPATTPPLRRSETPIKLAFEVDSISAVRNLAPGLGGQVDPRESEWRFRNAIHCDAVDPEGNVIQVVEGDAEARRHRPLPTG